VARCLQVNSLGCKVEALPRIELQLEELAKLLPRSRNVDSSEELAKLLPLSRNVDSSEELAKLLPLSRNVDSSEELAKLLPRSRNVDSSSSAQVETTLHPRLIDQERSAYGTDDAHKVMDDEPLDSQSSHCSFSNLTDLRTPTASEVLIVC
jgi:hypothetical protein